MVAKSFIKPQKEIVKKTTIQPLFEIKMADILEFGIERFGARVAYNFYANVMNKIVALSAMPHIHLKSRFIQSTEKNVSYCFS